MTRKEAHRRVYNTRRWKSLRSWKLSLSPICGCGRLATTVHHVEPIRQGGDPWDVDNLQSVCYRDHKMLHEAMDRPERTAWGQAVFDLLYTHTG